MEHQSKVRMLAIIVVVIIVAIITGWFLVNKKHTATTPPENTPDSVMCTMDARQCPDGSYVGRTGPHCEFVCPASPEETKVLNPIPALIQSYKDASTKYTLKYKTFEQAVLALQKETGTNLVSPNKIDTYVPGKLPREDGNPYFLFKSAIDQSKNDCLVGYMNLVTGEIESHHDVCIIYN